MKKTLTILVFLLLAMTLHCPVKATETSLQRVSFSRNFHKKCSQCKTALADLTGFNQTVGIDANILFTKSTLVDPRHVFDASTASTTGELITRHSGTFNIVFFAAANGDVQLQINGKVAASTAGFPTGFSITVPNVALKKGDVITLHNVSSMPIDITGANFSISLVGTGEAFGASTAGRSFGTSLPYTLFTNFGAVTTSIPRQGLIPFSPQNNIIAAEAFALDNDNRTIIVKISGTYNISFAVTGTVDGITQPRVTLFKNGVGFIVSQCCCTDCNPSGTVSGSSTDGVPLVAGDKLTLVNVSTSSLFLGCINPPLGSATVAFELVLLAGRP